MEIKYTTKETTVFVQTAAWKTRFANSPQLVNTNAPLSGVTVQNIKDAATQALITTHL